MTDSATSLDALLDGRVRLIQPKGGLRAAIDPILLAAAVPAQAGERVLEAGSGSGAAALCLAARVAGTQVVGLDVQADLIGLARSSAELNGLGDRVSFQDGDLLTPPPAIAGVVFDHVMANPPYMRAGEGNVSPDPARALASVEGEADLAAWVSFCVDRVRAGGSITFVHRADRAAEVAALLASSGADVVILPLGPKRALIQGIKTANGSDRGGSVEHAPGLTLHQPNGAFTPQTDAILREGHALVIAHRR